MPAEEDYPLLLAQDFSMTRPLSIRDRAEREGERQPAPRRCVDSKMATSRESTVVRSEGPEYRHLLTAPVIEKSRLLRHSSHVMLSRVLPPSLSRVAVYGPSPANSFLSLRAIPR